MKDASKVNCKILLHKVKYNNNNNVGYIIQEKKKRENGLLLNLKFDIANCNENICAPFINTLHVSYSNKYNTLCDNQLYLKPHLEV